MPQTFVVGTERGVGIVGTDEVATVTNGSTAATLYVGGPNVSAATNDFSIAASASRLVNGPAYAVASANAVVSVKEEGAVLVTTKATIDPAAATANDAVEQTFTVNGVKTGDIIHVNKPTVSTSTALGGARASAANQIGINYVAPGVTATNPASESYDVLIVRKA